MLLTISLISLHPSTVAYAQNEWGRITQHQSQPEQSAGGADKTGQVETITSNRGSEQKVRCSNGSLVDSGTECPSSDECPSGQSQNITLECIQPSQHISRNNNTNATNSTTSLGTDEINSNDEDRIQN